MHLKPTYEIVCLSIHIIFLIQVEIAFSTNPDDYYKKPALHIIENLTGYQFLKFEKRPFEERQQFLSLISLEYSIKGASRQTYRDMYIFHAIIQSGSYLDKYCLLLIQSNRCPLIDLLCPVHSRTA